MTATMTIDKAGRILLPKRIREKLNLRKGAKLTAEIVGHKIQLEEEAPAVKVVRMGGLRVIVGWEGFDAVKAIQEMRDEREAQLLAPFKKACAT